MIFFQRLDVALLHHKTHRPRNTQKTWVGATFQASFVVFKQSNAKPIP
jgi:hypothetical protein